MRNRRAFDRAVLWTLAVLMAGTAAWMLFAGEGPSTLIATIGAYFLGGLALVLPVLERLVNQERLPPPDPVTEADELARAIEAQWREESRVRRLLDSRVIPLTWAATRREVAAPPEEIYPDTGAGRIARVSLSGRLDHRFEDALVTLAEAYGRIPHGRLVVLGEPGAGKTVLAMLLTIGLLGRRQTGQAVPVLLSTASWDPVQQSLEARLVRALADSHYAGRREVPQRLLDGGLLLPVLDGLDEIPESARRSAVKVVNRFVRGGRPVVLTCRTTEYESVVAGGAPVLLQAPVVEVQPVTVTEATAFLEGEDWPAGTDWTPVVEHLRGTSESPLHEALATPLMLSLARMVYGRLGGDPAELLDRSRFDCRHAVEDFFSGRVVDAAYAPALLPSGEPDPDEPASAWQPEAARRWLTFLAHHLHRHGERDFAWWRMSRRELPNWAVLGGAVTLGMLLMGFVVVAAAALGGGDLAPLLVSSSVLGGTCTVALVALWFVFPERHPGQLSLTFQGSVERLRRGFTAGSLITAVMLLPVVVITSLVLVTTRRPVMYYIGYGELVAGSVAVAATVGLALAAHNWLDAPPPSPARATPESLLAQDRRSAFWGASLAGAVFVLTALPLSLAGLTVGRLAGQAATGWAGRPGRFDAAEALDGALEDAVSVLEDSWSPWTVIPLVGLAFTVTVLFSRAYPRFLVALVYLRLRGRLPWRLADFLADAHRKGLLRQSGPTYQFRHVRLQEYLVAAGGPDDPEPAASGARPSAVRPRVARLAVLAVSTVVLLAPYTTAPQAGSFRTMGPFLHHVSALAFSPDGTMLATVDGGDRLLSGDTPANGQVWTAGGRRLSRLEDAGRLSYLSFTPSGRTVVGSLIEASSLRTVHRSWNPWTGKPSEDAAAIPMPPQADVGPDRVVVRDPGTGEVLTTLTGPQARQVTDARPSPDGRFLLTRRYTGEAQLWRLADGHPLGRPVTGMDSFIQAQFSPDSSMVALGREKPEEIRLLATTDGRHVSTLPVKGGLVDIAFSPEAHTLVTADGYTEAQVWDTTSGRRIGAPLAGTAVKTLDNGDAQVRFEMSYAPDGRTLATNVGPRGQQLRLWDVASANPAGPPLSGHTDSVTTLDFSPDGTTLASGSDDRTVRLWRVGGSGPSGG